MMSLTAQDIAVLRKVADTVSYEYVSELGIPIATWIALCQKLASSTHDTVGTQTVGAQTVAVSSHLPH